MVMTASASGDRFRGRGGAARAAAFGALQRGLGEIEGDDVVAGLGQVRGHAAAHIAEPDECDSCH